MTEPTRPQDLDRTEGLTPAPPQEAGGDGQAPTATATTTAAPEAPPRLAEGVELLGRFEDSGYKDPPFIVRRPDGQMIHLPPLLYFIAEEADGRKSVADISAAVSERVGRGLDPEGAQMLIDERLRTLGVLAGPDGSSPELKKVDPLLGLKLKAALIPERPVQGISVLFKPLFFPPVVLGVLAGLVALDVWLFFIHGVGQSMRGLLYQPLYLLLAFGIVIVAAVFHEVGHATGCKYGGARPGAMGAGIYIVWPAFYTDVTDAYRLGKGGRLRTDLGGVYFNAIFILAAAGVYFLTGFEPILILLYLLHLEIIRQLLPILRFDGYLVLSDFTGVPDLFSRMKPILVSLVPGKKTDKRVKELKPWVRVAVTVWVLAIVPFLAFNIAMILVFAPRIFATGWDSFRAHLDTTTAAFGGGSELAGATGVIQMLALSLPAVGIAFGMSRASVRLTRKAWTGTEGRPLARTASFMAIAGAVALLGFVWWPDSDYKPIQPREKWTVQEAVSAVADTAQAKPAFAQVADESVSEGTVGAESDQEGDDPATDPVEDPTEEPTEGSTTDPSPEPTETAVSPSPVETSTG
jgi:putative peptide zinc metalloprotease protein